MSELPAPVAEFVARRLPAIVHERLSRADIPRHLADDLRQAAVAKLLEAHGAYDPARPYGSFAKVVALHAVEDELHALTSAAAIPRGTLRDARRALSDAHGDPAGHDDPEDVRRVALADAKPLPGSTIGPCDDGDDHGDGVALVSLWPGDDTPSDVVRAGRRVMARLEMFEPESARVLALRFGFNGPECSYAAIGSALGYSRHVARARVTAALAKARELAGPSYREAVANGAGERVRPRRARSVRRGGRRTGRGSRALPEEAFAGPVTPIYTPEEASVRRARAEAWRRLEFAAA